MRILAISVHPDDETLGCGGTLLKHIGAGDQLFWLIATQAYEPEWSADLIRTKANEVERVATAYGTEEVFKLGFPTTRLEGVPQTDLIKKVQEVISAVRPDTVYLVHHGDIHTDHHVFFTASMSVLKPFYMARLGVRRVLCYETLSSTEAAPALPGRVFLPNVFSDISPYLDQKIQIMSLFESEVHSDPFPRGPSSIRALARWRGATISKEYAEAFMLIREIN